MRNRALGFVALGAAASLLLTACGGNESGGGEASGSYDQGSTEIVNASDAKGGTLRYAMSSNVESMDPGNTYYGYMWNFSRYYARTLMTYNPEPGAASTEAVPDLAAEYPEVSDDGLTWTVKLREGLKYEDGSPIVAEDIKYAIARSNFGDQALPNGPKYFASLLADSDDYAGPYANDGDPLAGFNGIETPDDTTLIFHLKEPFADFPYVLVQPQSAPVPAEADRGEQYQTRVVSSGPYKFESDYSPGKGLTLVRNDQWDPETDPIRKALPDRITVEESVDQNEIDQRLVNGQLDVDLGGTGLGPAMKGQVLTDEAQKPFIDNPETGAVRYIAINNVVEPLDDVACRQAIMYAADHDALQRAWGGEVGGSIPTQVIPPAIAGHDPEIDLYPSEGNKGDAAKAKEKLEECGEPDGFSTNLGVRADRPTEVAAAEALQASLQNVGIKVNIKQYPSDTFTNTQAGSPDFVHENELGLNIYGWIPDWPTGYGFLSYIVDGDNIKDAGNSNISELDDPEINKLLDDVTKTTDPEEQAQIYSEIDRLVMESASILPAVFEKSVLYRPENLTNVYFHAGYAMYDYMALGVANTEQ
ncbi:ABC transporter substrate-binding protein [Marinactinospora thermotolerans]|uniref:Peptide/nickel transport system substrate-binding protein n=1 Tax=Marinactinospora thermotolerans DSM 45154 TaxID=1122192 RepID=A0A1T4T698_9ACTN|nr:ABC transporter substrate-binding protein [Marinactinospora thermotolerans]SKA35982.1 peptide/nickel transport system substrate-binding protein [Marinactinospora thermotolerans DSM 45154]